MTYADRLRRKWNPDEMSNDAYRMRGVPVLGKALQFYDDLKQPVNNSFWEGQPALSDLPDEKRLEMMGTMLPVDSGGLAGMLAGIGAKTANKIALKKAQEMAAQGVDRDKIWKDTGWYNDVDKQWKFEIDDSGSSTAMIKRGRKGSSLGEALEHPELLKAYPSMSKTKVTLGRGGTGGATFYPQSLNPSTPDRMVIGKYQNPAQLPHEIRRGLVVSQMNMIKKKLDALDSSDVSFDTKKGREYHRRFMELHDEGKKLAADYNKGGNFKEYAPDRSTVLHEAQHNIQDIEGFAQGGAAPNKSKKSLAKYKRLAGEAEAYNVEARKDLTRRQRKSQPPWETLDVPEEELLVRMLTDQ
tara:strand:- start:44 stop:1108 length:1065 start_codon:yes stop_codon:yes gene_type:complete